MSDPYTHPKYDDWKLATPWDDEDDSDLTPCDGECGLSFHPEELHDGLCRECEDKAQEIEEAEAEESEMNKEIALCAVCYLVRHSSVEKCPMCGDSRKA